MVHHLTALNFDLLKFRSLHNTNFTFLLGIPSSHVLLQTHKGALLGQAVLLHPLQLPGGAEGQRATARQEGNKSSDCIDEYLN